MYLLIYLILAVPQGIVLQPGIKRKPLAGEEQSLNHYTTREVSNVPFI